MTEGNGTLFPACAITFNDLSGYLTSTLNLTDGNSIVITAGKSAKDVSTVSRQYRVFGVKKQASTAGAQLTVIGLYDAPNFITANATEGYCGTTDKVLEKVCERCKLYFDGPENEMKDAQTWLCVSKTRAAFVQDVVRHGYQDEYSAMAFVLTSLGILKYKNIMQHIEYTKPKYTLYHNVPPSDDGTTMYRVKQAKNGSTAGMVNNWQNYGSTRVQHSLAGTAVVHNKLDVKTSGKYLAINKQVSDTVGRSRLECSPLDSSNTNSVYERALYQNLRFISLFCERESVLLTEISDIQLFDIVIYRQADADISIAAEPSDIYIVVGKSVLVKGSQTYAERLELARMSVTNKGQAQLATQDPSTLREYSTPESLINPTIATALQSFPLVSKITQMFAPIVGPVLGAYSNMSGLSTYTSAASMPLTSLVGTIAGPGLMSNPTQSISMLRQLNNPTQYLSQSVVGLANNYGQIDGCLGNAMTQLSGLSSVEQSTVLRSGLMPAALFNPTGVVTSLAMAFPMLRSLSQVSGVFSAVCTAFNQSQSGLVAVDPTCGQDIRNLNTHVNNINAGYSSVSTSTNNLWNRSIAIANHTEVPSDLYSYDHTRILNDLGEQSLQKPAGGRYKVTPLTDTSNSVSSLLQTTDANRNLLWMNPSTVINKLPIPYTPQELPSALVSMKADTTQLEYLTTENPIT